MIEPVPATPARPWGTGPCPRCRHDAPHSIHSTVAGPRHVRECDTYACTCGWVDGEPNGSMWPA